MSRFLFFILIIYLNAGISPDCSAQSKARKLFDNREYYPAIGEYEKELKKKKISNSEKAEAEAYLGMCHYHLNNPKEAVNQLKKGINHGHQTAEAYFILGLAYQKQESYKDALAAFNECAALDGRSLNVDFYIRSCDFALKNPEPNAKVKLQPSKVNTNGSEYGLSRMPENKIFYSTASKKGKIDSRTGLSFTEIFSAVFTDGDLKKPKKEKKFMKSYYNSGIFAYDSINDNIYLTMCDPKSGRCGIYESRAWSRPKPLFLHNDYDMAHPALANNGKRMYFVSNSPEGFGRTDIWYVDRIGDDQWGNPVNAGDKINTPEREEFPFIEGDSLLYFASTGHLGYGGLDIFAASLSGNRAGTPKNTGRPFNSGADDFNLITTGDKGLLISSRNIKNNDDIFIFNKSDLKPLPPEEKEEEKKEEIAEPEPVPEPVPETKPTPKPETVVQFPKNTVAIIYFDFDRFVPQRKYRQYDEIVAQMKKYPNAVFEIAGYADTRGGTSFNRELSDKRARYIAKRLMDRGINGNNLVIKAYGFDDPAVPNASTESEYQLNRRVEIKIIQSNQ
jgi:outer membrane protein OmpA-like peptidoglycan-associated protein/tetratricopeptide (TPR) repeat protein